jgi:hypothetical protein
MVEAFKNFHPAINSAASELEQLEIFAAKVPPDILSNMCAVERCLHGGSCISDASKPLGYTCQCRAGFYGYMCQVGKSITSFKDCCWHVVQSVKLVRLRQTNRELLLMHMHERVFHWADVSTPLLPCNCLLLH